MVGGWCLCGHCLYGMSGTDTDDILCGIGVVNAVNVRQRILLAGTCWYELTGLRHLLSAQGYDVCCVSLEYSCFREGQDLIIVALSAESITGWGQHLSRIRELRAKMSGKMVVLVPEKLKTLKVLRNVCPVHNGCEDLQHLTDFIGATLNGPEGPSGRFRLTPGQCKVLSRLSGRDRDIPLNLKQDEHGLYYHLARLAENAGVRDFRMLLMTGLDREMRKMEGTYVQGDMHTCRIQ